MIAEVESVITIEESVEPEPEVSLDFELDTDEQAYTVKPGDTLRKIAENYYGDESQYPRIVMANSGTIVQATLIYPGQELTIPDQNDPTYYTVKSGDTLSDIAEAYNGDSNDYMKIFKANGQLSRPDHIEVGQILLIPNLTA